MIMLSNNQDVKWSLHNQFPLRQPESEEAQGLTHKARGREVMPKDRPAPS